MYPVLFQIGGIEFYSNVVILFLGMITSILFLIKNVKKNGLSLEFLNDYFYILSFSFLLSGRLGDLFLRFDYYIGDFKNFFYFWDGNFSFLFGLIGLGAVFFLLTLFKKENIFKWLDSLIQPFLILILFTSFSDFLSGERYGSPTNSFLGIIFNSPEVKYTLPIHPVQMYEFLSVLIIMFILGFILRKKRLPGILSSLGFFLYFFFEFIIEFFRGGIDKIIFGYKIHQSLFLFLAFICLILFIFKSHKKIDFYNTRK